MAGKIPGVVGKGYRIWFPSVNMILTGTNPATSKITFKTIPKVGKIDVKEYLRKIYNLPVTKINTMNYLGKWKRRPTARRPRYHKTAQYKKVIVKLDKQCPIPELKKTEPTAPPEMK